MPTPAPRLGARVLLLDETDRVLLLHACDPDDPGHHWWELPGGGVDPGETLTDTAIREVAEETGIVLAALGPCVWIRETRFRYRDSAHHRRDHVFLARTDMVTSIGHTRLTEDERAGMLGQLWWSHADLLDCHRRTNRDIQADRNSSSISAARRTKWSPPEVRRGLRQPLSVLKHPARPAQRLCAS